MKDLRAACIGSDNADVRVSGDEHAYVRAPADCRASPSRQRCASLRGRRTYREEFSLRRYRFGGNDGVEGYCRHRSAKIQSYKKAITLMISIILCTCG